jgi:predicted SprT family Zn-dependent metalloprotease
VRRHRREAYSPITLMREAFTLERLQELWTELNARYFHGTLPAIEIEWSPRLTASSGMFVSRIGPRTRTTGSADPAHGCRLIRLSLPLLLRQSDQEILSTLAHEMIHQWQFDVLKKRPNHGSDFREKMAAMNGDGLDITIRHDLDDAVRALAKYAWRCLRCGRVYERQRRTIRPRIHQCGACRGQLRELAAALESI